ncbi:MAG: heavy-metal-associated domain-containing protein [Candidatus Promineifilaceae bacterium]|jgi:copper chaperone CopZ
METTTFTLNMMYGDHHVIEVRKLLSAVPGIEEIYASSCFHILEVTYDENKVDAGKITELLENAGYFGEMAFPVEAGTGSTAPNGDKAFYRHTAVLEQVGKTVSFAQKAPYEGRPLWPCPGVGAIHHEE